MASVWFVANDPAAPKKKYPRGGGVDGWFRGYYLKDGKKVPYTSSKETQRAAYEEVFALQEKFKRQKISGVEDAPPDITWGEMKKLYLEAEAITKGSYSDIESRLRNHLSGEELDKKLLKEVTGAVIQKQLAQMLVDGLSPQTRKHVRGHAFRIFEFARMGGYWRGENPVEKVPSIKLETREPIEMPEAYVEPLLRALFEKDVNFFMCGLFTGERKGEIAGLQVEDVDLDQGVLYARRSYQKPTKNKSARPIPILDNFRPFLEDQLERVRGKSIWLFPREDGSPRTRDYDAADIMKRAMVRAGIVKAWEHRCRRKGCGYKETRMDDTALRCPKLNAEGNACNFTLWPKGIPPNYSFKDLRSTFATWFYKKSRDIRAVSEILGHHSIEFTRRKYARSDVAHLVATAKLVDFGKGYAAATARFSEVPPTVPPAYQLPNNSMQTAARSRGLEPLTSGVTGREALPAEPGRVQQVGTSLEGCAHRGVHAPADPSNAARAKGYAQATEKLLTARQAAALLGIGAATVGYHVRTGAIPAYRVAGRLRLKEHEIEAFQASRLGVQ